MTNFSFRIPAKIKIFTNSPIQSLLKAIDNYITPATSEEFISSNYSEEKKKSLRIHYKLYHSCTDEQLKLAAVENMYNDGFRVEALDLLDRNH